MARYGLLASIGRVALRGLAGLFHLLGAPLVLLWRGLAGLVKGLRGGLAARAILAGS